MCGCVVGIRSSLVSQSTAAYTALTSTCHYTDLGDGGNRRFTVAVPLHLLPNAEWDWEAAPNALQR
jgi:hypothetical protein